MKDQPVDTVGLSVEGRATTCADHTHDGCGCGAVNNHSTKGVDDWSRRGFFKASILGAAAGWLAMQTGRATAAPRPVFRQPETPAAAIAELLDGNKRFAAGQLTFIDDDLAAIKKHVVSAQTPFASVLSCADSRVPVELVFDQGIGRLFVARVAGNIASPDMIASLEYGVAVPGTKAILVLGHANCGAVKATVGRTAAPGQISGLYSFIQPAVEKAPPHDLNAAIKANARIQASLLREASPVIASAVHEGRLKVAAAYYDLASGRVSILN